MNESIVDYIIRIGTEETENGSFCAYVDELALDFGVYPIDVRACSDDIVNMLLSREEVAEAEYVEADDCFSVYFWLNYCKDFDGSNDWGCAGN